LILKYKDLKVSIFFRNRKTLKLEIVDKNHIRVTAPEKTSMNHIFKFIDKNEKWIYEKFLLKRYIKSISQENTKLLFFGEEFSVKIITNEKERVYIKDKTIIVNGKDKNQERIKFLLKEWYRYHTKRYVETRINDFSHKLKLFPGHIRIKDVKTRWGSCSSKGNLNFNLRLAMAPRRVIDYVIIHEMCHLVHLNHSKEFWSLVGKILPDYKEYEKQLKEIETYMII
jgi:predicted metal-dependent hydrolase